MKKEQAIFFKLKNKIVMNKSVYRILAILGSILLVTILYFSHPCAEINRGITVDPNSATPPDTQFQIGILNGGQYFGYRYILDSLHFNTWHRYAQSTELGWDGGNNMDRYNNDTSDYKQMIIDRIDTNNNSCGMRTYMDRPIVEYVISGQRIDYQCESVPTSDPYWFWAYNNSFSNSNTIYDTIDNSRYGEGEKIKKCLRNNQEPGSNACWIDTSLKANRELSFIQTNPNMKDDAWDWYVMPRIRIDSAYANSPGGVHDTETVCRIKITGWRGDVVKDIGIRVENFKDQTNLYRGHYLDTFYFKPGQCNLVIPKGTITQYFIPKGDPFPFKWPDSSCLVDIKIYWTGKCDTWFDRVRVENFPAHDYLTLKDDKIVAKINSEITWSMRNYHNVPNYFYYEEEQFSHFPAIKELNWQIMDVSGGRNTLVIFLNYSLFKAHVPNNWNIEWGAETLKKYLKDDFGLNTILFGEYPFRGQATDPYNVGLKAYHPSSLFSSEHNYEPQNGILSYSASIPNYETYIQNQLDTKFINGPHYNFYCKIMDSLSKYYGMRVINGVQAHSTYWGTGGFNLKEPTNEELAVMTYIGLTYNAKGVMFFGYESFGSYESNGYQRGIMDNLGSTFPPRHKSAYNQDKFGKVKEISEKLHRWGPYLMSFKPSNTYSYIYRSEKSQLLANTFIKGLKTYIPAVNISDTSTSTSNLTADQQSETYMQASVFDMSSPDAHVKYFMIINRRCSPSFDNTTIDKIGGRRIVTIDLSGLPDFKNWQLYDLETNILVKTFDKNNTEVILGNLQPGEGKLYKLVAVI